MSTVGFGDFYPISNFERIMCTLIFVGGVGIFSMITAKFLLIIETFKTFNDNLNRGDELARFLVVLQKFNYNNPIAEDFRLRIEKYFDYRWAKDRNQAVSVG